jgi:hypothetical protein
MPDARAGENILRQPIGTYLMMIAMGFAPVALVLRFYGVLPNRTVIRWDVFGNTTVIGTRPATVLTIAVVGAAIAVVAVLIGALQHRALAALALRRPYLALNLAQLTAIALTCSMVVSEALGFQIKFKPMIPPAMSVLVFAAGVLCWRLEGQRAGLARWLAVALIVGAAGLLAFSAIAMNAVVGYYASGLAALAMAAIALPEQTR